MKTKGFTIVELLIVIVVIAILAAITVVAFNGISERAESTKIISQANAYIKALKLWEIEQGRPATATCIAPSSYATCAYVQGWTNNAVNDATFNAELAKYSGIATPQMSTKFGPHNPAGLMFYHPNWYGANRGILGYSVGPSSDCGPGVVMQSDHVTPGTSATKFTVRTATYTQCEIEVFKY